MGIRPGPGSRCVTKANPPSLWAPVTRDHSPCLHPNMGVGRSCVDVKALVLLGTVGGAGMRRATENGL